MGRSFGGWEARRRRRMIRVYDKNVTAELAAAGSAARTRSLRDRGGDGGRWQQGGAGDGSFDLPGPAYGATLPSGAGGGSLQGKLAAIKDNKREAMKAKFEAQTQAIMANARTGIERAAAERERRFQADFEEVLEGLEGRGIRGEMDELLRDYDECRLESKKDLCDDWNKNVYEAIRRPIREAVEEIGISEIKRRNREASDAYMKTTSEKGGVFLDVVIESDYDPFAKSKSGSIRVRPKIRDPLVGADERDVRELQAAGKRVTRVREPGKETLNATLWGAVESTQYGHFEKVTTAEGGQLTDPKKAAGFSKRNQARIPMDHFGFDRGVAAVLAENPIGKRTVMAPPFLTRREVLLKEAEEKGRRREQERQAQAPEE